MIANFDFYLRLNQKEVKYLVRKYTNKTKKSDQIILFRNMNTARSNIRMSENKYFTLFISKAYYIHMNNTI